MIDFHSHILPAIDDGSKSIEDSIQILREAREAGFSKIISTSHYLEGYYEVEEEERKRLIQELRNEDIGLELYVGSEIYITENIIKLLEERKATSINNTNYVLFEFPLNSEPLNMYDIIYDMLEYKLVPILAHPERYSFVQKNPNLIYDLIQKGVLMQSNYGSIIGLYGDKAQIIVKKLLENNMVHFLGRDVHKKNSIYPKVQIALKEIENIVGREKLEELTTINPAYVLENKSIDIDEPREIKLSLKEKMKINFKK